MHHMHKRIPFLAGLKWGRIWWKNDKNGKTKMVVWAAKMVAMNPEKKIWTAEIELYRWVMSNGPYGFNMKKVSMFLGFWAEISTRYCWQVILWCFRVRGGSESCNFGSQNSFLVKFWSKTFFLDLCDLFFVFFSTSIFWFFWHLRISLKKLFFWWWFSLFLFNFAPKILPEPPL